MATASAAQVKPRLYLMELEYTRAGNGLWHELDIMDRGDKGQINQAGLMETDKPVAKKWKPLPVCVQRFKRMGAFAQLYNTTFAANLGAVKVLSPLLGKGVELLPLKIVADYKGDSDLPWGLYTKLEGPRKLRDKYPPMLALHALDRVDLAANAVVEYWSSRDKSKGVRQVLRHAFQPEDIAGKHFFKIRVKYHHFASEEFRKAVTEAGLGGLVFKEVDYDLGTGKHPCCQR